jgi:hypothetical protein
MNAKKKSSSQLKDARQRAARQRKSAYVKLAIDEVLDDENNENDHSEEQIVMLRASIREFGQVEERRILAKLSLFLRFCEFLGWPARFSVRYKSQVLFVNQMRPSESFSGQASGSDESAHARWRDVQPFGRLFSGKKHDNLITHPEMFFKRNSFLLFICFVRAIVSPFYI